MTFETLQFMADHAPDTGGSAVAASLAKAAADDAAEEARERRAAGDRRAASAERMEALAIQNRALGDPMGAAQAARSAMMAADDEIADLTTRLARLQDKRDRARSNLEFFTTRMQAAQDCALRSDPLEAATRRAQDALAQVRRDAAGDDVLRRARAGQAKAAPRLAPRVSVRSRPFGDSGDSPPAQRAVTRRRLEDYGYGESIPDGCPPCGGCGYVICRCPQYPAGAGRAAYGDRPRSPARAVMS
jgi:hypothetical protein